MKMTKAITLAALVAAAASGARADEAFDALKELASTPTNKITTVEQANAVLDAAVAVTNSYAVNQLVDGKLVDASYAHKAFFNTKRFDWAARNAMQADDVTLAKEVIAAMADAAVAKDAAMAERYNINAASRIVAKQFGLKAGEKGDDTLRFASAEDAFLVEQAQKILASEPADLSFLGTLLSTWSNDKGFTSAKKDTFIEANLVKLKALALASTTDSFQYSELMLYFFRVRPEVLDVSWVAEFQFKNPSNGLYFRYCITFDRSNAGKAAFSKKAAEIVLAADGIAEDMLLRIAKALDAFNKSTAAQEALYAKLTSENGKLSVAFALNDASKLIDICLKISDKQDAKMIEKILTVLNSVDADFREADMKKALRNINKKYTTKLYEDRDTWEPILSKVRAMLDTYND